MDGLPDELLATIFAAVPCVDRVARCALVCRRWHAVASEEVAIGRRICVRPTGTWWSVVGESRCRLHCLGRWYTRNLSVCDYAAAAGHVDCMRRACDPFSRGAAYDARTAVVAAAHDRPDALAWLLDRGVRGDTEDAAVRLALLQAAGPRCTSLLLKRGIGIDRGEILAGTQYGNLTIVRHARERGFPIDSSAHCRAVVGYADHVKYLHCAHRPSDGPDGRPDRSADWRHVEKYLDVIRYVRAVCGVPIDRTAFLMAVRAGEVNLVRTLFENGYPPDAAASLDIVRYGKRRGALLRYAARPAGCPWDGRLCEAAAETGCVRILDYLHRAGCPWDRLRCAAAARGSGDVLRYIRNHSMCRCGCP